MREYQREFETDSGEMILVPSKVKASGVMGNEVKQRLSRKSRKKLKQRKAGDNIFCRDLKDSQIVSPTLIVCEAAEQEGWFPPSMGGTNGEARIHGAVTGRDLRRAGTTKERTEVWKGNLQAY